MRARIVDLASPRRVVAAECCVVVAACGAAVLVVGPTLLAVLGLVACAVVMAFAALAIHRLERRRT